jgi:hypothetical protein
LAQLREESDIQHTKHLHPDHLSVEEVAVWRAERKSSYYVRRSRQRGFATTKRKTYRELKNNAVEAQGGSVGCGGGKKSR